MHEYMENSNIRYFRFIDKEICVHQRSEQFASEN